MSLGSGVAQFSRAQVWCVLCVCEVGCFDGFKCWVPGIGNGIAGRGRAVAGMGVSGRPCRHAREVSVDVRKVAEVLVVVEVGLQWQ